MKTSTPKSSMLAVAIALAIGGTTFTSCSSDSSSSGTVQMEVEVPTEGLITTVQEVQPNQFKISDEQTVKDTADSRIIANYLDNTSDTFTLAQARLIQTTASDSRAGSVVQSAGMGYFGYMMLGSMMMNRHTPTMGAYTNSGVYNNVSQKAGASMKSSAVKTTRTMSRPSSGRSGYGSGRSTRSFGG